MDDETPLQKSFSAWKRFGFNLDLLVRTLVVLAVVVMVNYLGARWYQRLPLGQSNQPSLSERTLGLLKSITNDVNVIVYYDRDEALFGPITSLLEEYRDVNSHIHVSTVDYIRNAGAAEKLAGDEKFRMVLAGNTNKDLVIFECAGVVLPVSGARLGQIAQEQVPNAEQIEIRRRLVGFHGESLFTGALLAVLNPKPFKAYYLIGHDEHAADSPDALGYSKFIGVLGQNRVRVEPLSLLGTNTVPGDCNLLIIAGPRKKLHELECDRVDDYLRQGGRLLAFVNSGSTARWTGLEGVLNGWGVIVGNDQIVDRQNTSQANHTDVIAVDFNDKHPIANPLQGSQVQFILPRPVEPMTIPNAPADAARVTWLAASSRVATSGTDGPRRFSLAVAVEKGNVAGMVTERGNTRIVAAGDSLFLANNFLNWQPNRDFLELSLNWLLERSQLMQGIGPRPVAEYRLNLTQAQQRSTRWLMLGALPGGVLLFGGLVWLRRRK